MSVNSWLQFDSTNKASRRTLLILLAVIAIVALGWWLKTLTPGDAIWRLPATQPIATLYFADGPYLFPVSRRLPPSADSPRATLEELLNGPPPGSGLKNAVPPGTQIRSFRLTDGVASVDLSAEFLKVENPRLAETAVIDTLTALPEVSAVVLTVDGKSFGQTSSAEPASRVPLLYFASANGLVGVPAEAAKPRAALETYLRGPAEPAWNGLPSDVRLLKYDYAPDQQLVSLSFTYTPSVRALAVDRPDRMRLALLGLIASLTEYRDVKAVRIDFEGRTRLGLGECSDLLLSPQPRPRLLNDERLLGR